MNLTLTKAIKSTLNHLPALKAIINHCRICYWRLVYHLHSFNKRTLNTSTVYYIETARINYGLTYPLKKWKDRGKIISGDWDQHKKVFEAFDVYISFEQHFQKKMAWQETPLYKRILNEIAGGKIKWNCSNEDELMQRFAMLENIFYDIKQDGYKSQTKINNNTAGLDEIALCIDRNGHYILFDGRHRLAMTKLLGIKLIPVQITAIHRSWFDFQCEVEAYAQKHGGKVYAPITHPSLSHIPSFHDEGRFHLIKNNLPLKSGDLLDIGAHWGYFCHKFEDEGFNCFAVEQGQINLYFLNKLRLAENKNFKVIDKSIFEYKEKYSFDIVLALYIFHHFLKTKETFEQFIEFLKKLKVKFLFFSSHAINEPQMKGAYRNFHHEEFVDFILSHSCFSSSKLLGEVDKNRFLYRLSA